jgi:archaellum biogenesis ATPase FlaH
MSAHVEIADLVFTPLEEFAAVDEPGADALARAIGGGTVIPARGLVLIFGDGGAGKTTLAIDAAFALAAGDPWLGLVETDRPLRIAIIEAEGPRQEFRDKLERKLAHHGAAALAGRISVLEEPWAEFTFADESQRRALALAIVENETDLLIVGPVVSVGMVGGGTPDEIRAFEQLLHELRALVERPFAIVLVHHENRLGRVSGAWERVPDTLMHVTGQGHGRTRVYWQKARWSSAMHGTTTHLLWAEGETFIVEAKPEVTEDTIADDLLAAARDNPGASWTKIREHITGNTTDAAKVRDRLIAAGTLINSAARDGYFNLWHHDDPAAPRSDAGTALERLTLLPPAGATEASRSAVPYVSRNGIGNGTASAVPEATDDYLDELFADLEERGVA